MIVVVLADLALWTQDNFNRWISWADERFSFKVNREMLHTVSGKSLASMDRETFKKLFPCDTKSNLWISLQILKMHHMFGKLTLNTCILILLTEMPQVLVSVNIWWLMFAYCEFNFPGQKSGLLWLSGSSIYASSSPTATHT